MAQKTVLSGRQVKSRAASLEMSVRTLNNKAGFGTNYLYRLWGKETVTLETVNRIAIVLGCNVCDLLEEIEESETKASGPKTEATVKSKNRRRKIL
jgi:DNA-binding Xre family transcriptional regulator